MENQKLALKNKLFEIKNKLTHRLIYESNGLSIQERKIISESLDDVNALIEICKDRNRF